MTDLELEFQFEFFNESYSNTEKLLLIKILDLQLFHNSIDIVQKRNQTRKTRVFKSLERVTKSNKSAQC